MTDHPYQALGETSFWASAVAQREMKDISGLWQAPFPIEPKMRIATFGSCFAQHFSRALVARGFSWLDAEPAPGGASDATRKTFNYGVFSARTGNIYTVSLLRQWTEWALGVKKAPKIYWLKNGRYIDPFRPAIEPGGFGSLEEMLASREATIAGFKRAIMGCDIFVFTLGLTESWWDDRDAIEYPLCPGTVAGDFDPTRHRFQNQSYPFIHENLLATIRMIRAARKTGPKFLLTVSPVPLTATNSGNHVLVATMESKSILRAVAGSVARELPDVSYFPSYEIISAFPFKGSFFEPNLRNVKQEGVDFVMASFFAGLGDQAEAGTTAQRPVEPEPTDEDLACEEQLLAAFGKRFLAAFGRR